MARRKVGTTESVSRSVMRRCALQRGEEMPTFSASLEPGFHVEAREIDGSRPLWIVTPEEFRELLAGGEARVPERPAPGLEEIVRIDPPDDAQDADVERVRALFEGRSAAVRVTPRRRPEVVVQKLVARERATHRQVVEQMVAEANVEERSALAAFCEGVMSRVGL